MKNWTIRARIAVSFAVILALMTVMAAVAYTHLIRIEQLSSGIDQNILPKLNYSNQIAVDQIANYSLTEQYALQSDVATKQKLQAAILASRDYTKTLFEQYGATISTPEERQLFESFKGAQDLYAAAQDELLAIGMDAKGQEQLIKRIDADLYPKFEEAQAVAGAVVEYNKTAADESTRLITEAVTRAKVGGARERRRGIGRRALLRLHPASGDYAAARPAGRHPGCDAHGRSVRPPAVANATTNSARSRPDSIA